MLLLCGKPNRFSLFQTIDPAQGALSRCPFPSCLVGSPRIASFLRAVKRPESWVLYRRCPKPSKSFLQHARLANPKPFDAPVVDQPDGIEYQTT